jgi:hypothetical protein
MQGGKNAHGWYTGRSEEGAQHWISFCIQTTELIKLQMFTDYILCTRHYFKALYMCHLIELHTNSEKETGWRLECKVLKASQLSSGRTEVPNPVWQTWISHLLWAHLPEWFDVSLRKALSEAGEVLLALKASPCCLRMFAWISLQNSSKSWFLWKPQSLTYFLIPNEHGFSLLVQVSWSPPFNLLVMAGL